MTRYINALLVFLMVLSAAAVYDMKYEAEIAAENIKQKQAEIAQAHEDISLLKAEWALLTRPARMRDLLERHKDILSLTPLSSDHIGTLADIPEKPVVPPVDAPVEQSADGSAALPHIQDDASLVQ
ncbi:hypothetical protein CXZ10_01140 [Pleomorphomonas diazotrophica]|uniref:Cell division protein FtsL n=1 Tax=Pleomorphomonas diazotrophica TaxID=1166257 RepID=A0A1I4VDV0_9HYPH|nr:hypothetical protein [Pleomorphomonas diazotrophica]PKR90027.1 hypothetical protein CXZ10_01140 [Pleomorphomonas diazotrophica]SFM99336.1 hypothetical protein SAMN05192571_11139 [Pleomorphomonas diazotrophica]